MENIELLALASQFSRTFKLADFQSALSQLAQGQRLDSLSLTNTQLELSLKGQQLDQLKLRLQQLKQSGTHLCYPGHSHYPAQFQNLSEPPLCLLVRGSSEVLSRAGIAVVGSRNPHRFSEAWMDEHLGEFLTETPATIISGGARGVDQKAHLIALRKQRPTIVFCPSGLDVMYPRELQGWTERVIDGGGAFVSEYWMDQRMRSYHFLQRNRLIAALGSFLVVVEARLRSGSQMTARLAANQGREVAAIPSHPSLVQMRGSIELIRSGAQILIDAKDLKYLWQCTSQTHFIDPNI